MRERRRCTSESCLVTASNLGRTATLELPVANILHNPMKDWNRVAYGKSRIAHDRKLEVDWKQFNNDEFLFTHATIVASVDVAENGYYINDPCNELVNSNGNAWSNQVLLSTFRSFIGGENYYEHIQIPTLSKGKILDAVLRPVKYKGDNGKIASVYYCDILTATHRSHTDLVRRIAGGELATMSMGCVCHAITCSKCGSILLDNENCDHLDNEMMQYFTDENGIKRIVAELCGRVIKDVNGAMVGDSESVKFIEASWVENPAFKGAVINHYISEIHNDKVAGILNMPTREIQELTDSLFKLRVADKDGMIPLRVAREVLKQRRREELVDRVASHALKIW